MSFLHFCFEVNRKIFKANSRTFGQLKGKANKAPERWHKWKVCQDRNQCQDLFIVQPGHFVQLTGFLILAGGQRLPETMSLPAIFKWSHLSPISELHSVLIALSSNCRFNQQAISSYVTKAVTAIDPTNTVPCVSISAGN